MSGLARLSTGTSPARSSPSYSHSRPVSPLLHRPIEFTVLLRARLAPEARYIRPQVGTDVREDEMRSIPRPSRPRPTKMHAARAPAAGAMPPRQEALAIS